MNSLFIWRRWERCKEEVNPMLPEIVVTSANACQMAVPFIALSAYLPQWIQLVRTKSSRDISLRSWCIWTLSSFFGLFYAIVQLRLNGRG
jgi:hypothetical protein